MYPKSKLFFKFFKRCAFPFTWMGQTYKSCAPINTPSSDDPDCAALDEFLKNQKNGNYSKGISEEIKLLSANGKDKKCYPTMPGLYGWSVYFEIVIEIEKNLLFQHSSELVYFTRLYLPLFAIFKLTVFGLNIGLKSSFMVTQFPQK